MNEADIHSSSPSPSRASSIPFVEPEESPPRADSSSPVSQQEQDQLDSRSDFDREVSEPPEEDEDEDENDGRADVNLDDPQSSIPAAYCESPPVRLAYLHAISAQILEGATYEAANNRLRGELELIGLCGALPLYPIPATTVVTAKRRFNIHADDHITTKPICSLCFRPYTFEEIGQMDSPDCLERACKKGKVYREKRTRGAATKRVPVKILAYSSLVGTIQRFLLRPDFFNNLVDTKDCLDRPPITEDTVLSDIHDGEAWVP